MDLVELRLNDNRGLSKSLRERIHNEGKPRVVKTHFFLMREANNDYIFSHNPPTSIRRLEGDVWKGYTGDGYSFDRIITYHWRDTDPEINFSAFAKFKTYRSNIVTLGIFILGILVFGIFSGLVANWAFNHFTGG